MNGYSRLVVVMATVVVASSVAVYEAKARGQEPVSPDDEEVAAHLVGKTAVAEDAKTGMKMHFRPFEDQGHPVPARFGIDIPVHALVEQSPKRAPFPRVHNWKSVKIVLSRTGCFGTCPGYRIEVHGDGAVVYDGRTFVAVTGSHRASVSADVVSQMVEAFRAADYFSQKDVNVREVVSILLDPGADPNIADKMGITPLNALWLEVESARMLIAHGAKVNARSFDGSTPLINASGKTVELTRLLLEHGADPFAKDEDGETALDWAKRWHHKDQAALLQGAMARKKR